MPQNTQQSNVAISSVTSLPAPLRLDSSDNLKAVVSQTPAAATAPLNLDVAGSLRTNGGGTLNSLNVTAGTVVKDTPGRVCKIIVTVAGSAPGNVYDRASTSGVAAANQIATIPNTVGPIALDFPALVGITVVPGTGQTIAVSYE